MQPPSVPPSPRVLALGLHWRRGGLLVSEVVDNTSARQGYRPIGRAPRFGECWRDAIARAFHDDLGIEVRVRGDVLVHEAIGTRAGQRTHDIALVAEVMFPDGAQAGQSAIPYSAASRLMGAARWIQFDRFDTGPGTALFPDGLKDCIAARQGI